MTLSPDALSSAYSPVHPRISARDRHSVPFARASMLCLILVLSAPKSDAANVTYSMSGVVSKTQWVGTSPHSGVVVGAPMTGFFVIDDAA
jgi:hypothetical protein